MMKSIRTRNFLLYWLGFSALIYLLVYIAERTTSGFAIALSILGAVPVALILAHRTAKGDR